jgi:alpha-beta hydrolase superfamily lysophospholipase
LSSHAFYLQAGEGPIFAVYHEAEQAARSNVATLLCPPFGWDDMCSYRSRRDWAQRLARDGHPTLRLDLPGTGDSAGGPGDTRLMDTWTQAIATAAEWLQTECKCKWIAAIGIGLGGLLAWRSIVSFGAPIDDLILWAVPARGKTLVRELRAFSRLEVAGQQASNDATAHIHSHSLSANGYALSAETVEALERLDLGELALPDATHRHVLALGRDKLPVDSALRNILEHSGAQLELAAGSGYGAMMIEPQESRPPLEVFDRVSSWLTQTRSTSGHVQETPNVAREPVEITDIAALNVNGVPIRETPFTVNQPFGALFGILTEPCGATAQLTAVLLNAGPQRRIGPNRMWVETARRWASQGVATARIDLAGLGDADGDALRFTDTAAFYTGEFVDQVRAVMNDLESRGLPGRFVLMGLCAGAFWSAHTALADERVVSVYLLNPRALVWDAWTSTARRVRAMRELALRGSTWRRVLRGEITLSKHIRTATAIVERAIGAPLRMATLLRASLRDRTTSKSAATQGPADDELDRLLDRLRNNETPVLMLFTGKEPLYRELQERGRLAQLERWPNLQLMVSGTSADTHTLAPVWLQQQVNELIDKQLGDEITLSRSGLSPVDSGSPVRR